MMNIAVSSTFSLSVFTSIASPQRHQPVNDRVTKVVANACQLSFWQTTLDSFFRYGENTNSTAKILQTDVLTASYFETLRCYTLEKVPHIKLLPPRHNKSYNNHFPLFNKVNDKIVMFHSQSLFRSSVEKRCSFVSLN